MLMKVVREKIASEVIDSNFKTFLKIVVKYSFVV